MKPETPLFFLILSVLWLPASAQDVDFDDEANRQKIRLERQADSLKSLSFKDKLQEVVNVRKIIIVYRDFDIDSALVYSEKELALTAQLEDRNQLAIARINASSLYQQQGDLSSAIELLLKNQKENINDTLVAHTASSLSSAYFRQGQLEKSVSFGIEAANAFERLKDSINAGYTYLLIGRTYSEALKDFDQAAAYADRAIPLLDNPRAPKDYIILAYMTRAGIHLLSEEYEDAMSVYNLSYELAKKQNLTIYYPTIYYGIGKTYYFTGEYQKSISYLLETIDKPSISAKTSIQVNKFLGLNYLKLGEIEKAIPHFNFCLQHKLEPSYKVELKGYLVECYEQTGNYKRAYELQQEILNRKDSINASEQTAKVAEIVERYENEKKQLRIDQLNQENLTKEARIARQYYIIWSIVILALLLGVGGFIWLRLRQKLKEGFAKMENAKLRQQFLRIQLNPHFLFHALSSIEGYIYTNEKKSAAAFLRNFSSLMRNILESSDLDFISLQDDIEMIRKYLSLQQLNNDFKFDYRIEVAEDLDPKVIKIPPMLIQPTVENAILHGALSAKKGAITVSYALSDNHLEIRIHDNGPGQVAPSRTSGTLHRSMSGDIVKQRISNLKETHGIEIKQSVINSREGDGTTVVFSIPLQSIVKDIPDPFPVADKQPVH